MADAHRCNWRCYPGYCVDPPARQATENTMTKPPLYVRDITHPKGECPLHGTTDDCPCNDTGLLTERDLREMAADLLDGDGDAG